MKEYKDRAKRFAVQYGPVIAISVVAGVKLDRYRLSKSTLVHIPQHVADRCMAGDVAKLTLGDNVLRLTKFDQ